ncbi:hypothetical protein ARMSODRAFT_619801 [Armillaria solidipes]|uniref:Uncharacterized protein n=1 Tax=Armillaria solidipes TaxID=1076256 RepID=A0A2H3ASN0_9AGAR|nr:hypothetical protein ARMSODRAFT_619801 [Armillaria solidipes]
MVSNLVVVCAGDTTVSLLSASILLVLKSFQCSILNVMPGLCCFYSLFAGEERTVPGTPDSASQWTIASRPGGFHWSCLSGNEGEHGIWLRRLQRR